MSKIKKLAMIQKEKCVACGSCAKVCPRAAISIPSGIYALVANEACVGCGFCAKECPASVIHIVKIEEELRSEKQEKTMV